MLVVNRFPRQRSTSSVTSPIQHLMNTVISAAGNAGAVPAALPMNIWHDDAAFHIEAELPGFSMDSIDIRVLGDQVAIKGERQFQPAEGSSFLRRERWSGSFERAWTLPSEIDAEHVTASLRDGVLRVTLPKVAKVQPKKIQVAAG